MASKKTAKKIAKNPVRKKRAASKPRRSSSENAPGLPTATEISPPGDPLRRPVLFFAAATLAIFASIYFVYGPCASFARFSGPPASDLVSVNQGAAAVDSNETQTRTKASAIDALRIPFAKKTVAIDETIGALLKPIAEYLREVPDAKLEIVGHTCNIGQYDDNDQLSLERAEAVRDYLARRGVDRDRLTAIGRGEREPVASNSSAAGRIRNRRVEFRLLQ
jgi:outer membrane protein OmpA-like peptidoglycan-associated protein